MGDAACGGSYLSKPPGFRGNLLEEMPPGWRISQGSGSFELHHDARLRPSAYLSSYLDRGAYPAFGVSGACDSWAGEICRHFVYGGGNP